jgi:CHASE3 domain sensor protein
VKEFIKNLRQKTIGVGELIESKSPMVKARLAELGHSAIEQASAAQEVLEHRSAQAREMAQQVIDSPQAHAISDSISSGIDQLKSTVDKAVSSIGKTEKAPPMSEYMSEDESKLTKAISKLGGRDKIGVSSEVMTAAGGAAAGAAAAGTIAGAAGATTLLGSTGLASLFGGVFVAATPVGWVIGSAVIAGAAGYGLMKMARSGAQQDIARKEMIGRLTDRLSALKNQDNDQAQITELKQLVALTLASEVISDDQGRRMIELVENGSMKPAMAINRLNALAIEAGIIEKSTS